MEKLNVNRCKQLRSVSAPLDARADGDEAEAHLWSSEPTIEITELGPVAWWVCGRCPARVLHDPETEDGFPEEPIVVYPPSCFDVPACGQPLAFAGAMVGCRRKRGHDGDHCPEPGCRMHDGEDPKCEVCGEHCHEPDRFYDQEDGVWAHPVCLMGCGCPATASGDVVHLEGCNAAIEENLRDKEAGFTGPLSLACGEAFGLPESAGIVHPPTDPAPPSEELKRAIEDAEDEADDAPTLKRITPVESAASIFERVEALFGRPLLLGDDDAMDLAFDALGGIEG